MGKLWIVLVVGTVLAATTQAGGQTSLIPYLQAEVNEVAELTAQVNHLQQQGDALGAAVLASYIPDHRMMITQLSAAIQQQGGDPSNVTAKGTPFLGTRAQIIDHQMRRHAEAMDNYADLARRTTNEQRDFLATLGRSGAWRHYNSLVVARGATLGTPEAIYAGLLASQALEQAAINDLQTHATQLTALGDPTTATLLSGMIQAHQQQLANLQTMANSFASGQNISVDNRTRITTLPPLPVLTTRPLILSHFQVMNTQFINTYALAINGLPPGPLQRVMADGQAVALTGLAALQRLPIA